MEGKYREKLIVGIAAILFFAAFGAVAYFDRPHGAAGDDFGQDDFNVVMEKNEGHLSIAEFPPDLYIFGAGNKASLDFTVTNNDEDNDIDTVYITVPDGEVLNATTEWYDSLFTHDWDFSKAGDDVAKLSAGDDLPGRVFGGSVQYDVAGNIDDALDHNALLGISEGITITLEFNAPSTPGIKMGSDAIGLEVSDEQTEGDVSSGRYSVDPFPYPYLVIGTDYEFLLFELTGGNAGLDIEYGGSRLFGSGSRASDLSMSAHGFKYVSTDGSTVAVIEVPSDPSVIVNPLIMSISDGGEYALDMYHYRTLTVDPATPSTSWVSVVSSQEGYTGILPGTAGSLLELDMDGDGLFTDNDDDIDGDGIPNDEDTDPYNSDVRNHHPSVTVEASSLEIANNKDLVLEATGADVDGDALSYSWSVSPSTGWTAQVASVTVDLDDYVRGSYTFTVAVSDGKGGSDQASVTVDVTEGEDQNGTPIWLVVLIIVVVLVIVGAVVFYVLRGEKGSDEEPLEMEQPREEDGEEQVEISAASGGYYEQAETIESSAPIKEETMQGYEESLDPDEPYVSQPVPEPLPVESEMQEVQDLEFLIDEMERTEEEIGDICPECGATLGPTDPNCPNCGAEFDIALECPSCGAVIEDGAEVCPSCGVTFQ